MLEVPSSMIQPWLVAEFTVIELETVVLAGGFLTQDTLICRASEVAHPDDPQIEVTVKTFKAPLVYNVFEFETTAELLETSTVS